MAAICERPVAVSFTVTVPPPPAVPDGAKFWGFAVGDYSSPNAKTLGEAVRAWRRKGTEADLAAVCERYVPCDAACRERHGDRHDDEATCGSYLFRSTFNAETEAWGEWKPE